MRSPSPVRALVLLSVVLELPVLGRVVRGMTREPVAEEDEWDGVPVEIVRPPGTGPWPAWLFVNGAHPDRRREPVVTRLSRGLARAGYLVVVPDVPGLGEGTITDGTVEAAFAVTERAASHADVAGDRVALVGASTGAGLALLTAAQPELAGRVSVVAAVAPFADLEKMVCLATTGRYSGNGGYERYETTDLHRRVVARSLVATLGDGERSVLIEALDRAEHEGLDPREALALADEDMSREARAVLSLLRNDDAERFGELFEALPAPALALVRRLSPLGSCDRVIAPVELVVPPSDAYFPPGEAQALAAALPNVRLTVTATLDHTRPKLSMRALRDARRFGGFVVRGLAAAG
jgi:acetyl esterase/lipase